MAAIEEFGSDDVKVLHEHGLDFDNETIYLDGTDDSGEITAHVAWRFRKNLNLLVEYGTKQITVEINSVGGEVTAGLSVYDSILCCPVPVTGRVTGEASSMASVILQACSKRIVSPNACVMYHAGASGMDKPAGEFPNAAAFSIAEGERIDQMMYGRVLFSAHVPWPDFQTRVLRGIYLTANQAVEFGWADEIMTVGQVR